MLTHVILYEEKKIKMLEELIKDNLLWFPEKGFGYYPVKDFPYNENYFNKYEGYARTNKGKKINQIRVSFVSKNFSGKILDVGIGSGQFVTSRKDTYGFDINPVGVKWLKKQKLFFDLYGKEKIDAITFWDSLEHIENLSQVVGQARKWVFVSMPIYQDLTHMLKSKHFRKDEHFWYFTHDGLVRWFSENSFDLADYSNAETQFREDIFSYAFRRRENG